METGNRNVLPHLQGYALGTTGMGVKRMKPAKKTSKANATPTKAFFVRMITRDISLEDCIFDLIDNSIDGAWELSGGSPMSLEDSTDLSAYKINIQIEGNRFEISDNCGGITRDNAENYAFTFGRREEAEIEDYSIGVYGIGMKRSVFKLGSDIEIRSTYQNGVQVESYRVPIKVKKWLQETEWDFDIEDAGKLDQAGVKITVTDLNEATQRSFQSPGFILNLKRAIARDYSLHLNRGLNIEVQGESVNGWRIELRQSNEFLPMKIRYGEEFEQEQVLVEILAGMSAPPPVDNDPDEKPSAEPNRDGWYVICNGRVVLAADKTVVTGWGVNGTPQWHPQYSGFMGIILFSSRHAGVLPLTTTKRNVDESSAIFRRSKKHMSEATQKWIAYTNARKHHKEEANAKETIAKAIKIFEVAERKEIGLPKLRSIDKEKEANVLYSVPESKIRKLAAELGDINMSYKQVGYKSFKFAYDKLVGDE